MNIYILHDETESGPFGWGEILVMLHREEISETDIVRVGEDSRSIREWGLWTVGAEVGPLSWDEVTLLLEQGVLDLENPAKLEGESQLSSLRDVIGQSREVECGGERKEPPAPRIFSIGNLEIPILGNLRTGPVLTCAILIFFGISLFAYLSLRSHPSKNTGPKTEIQTS